MVANSAAAAARGAVIEARPWVARLARLGYAAKGVVYLVVGGIALQAAFGAERAEGAGGALREIAEAPFGRVLLGVVTVGLVGYVLWKLVQAFVDPENNGDDLGGIVKRVGFFVSAVLHGALAFEAGWLVLGGFGSGSASASGAGGAGGDSGPAHWTAMVMEQPLGRWAVGIAGAATVAYGLYQLWRAWTVKLTERLDLWEMDATRRAWVVRAGRFGLAARGVVFGIIGWGLVQAALQYDPQESAGLGEALRILEGRTWLLALVAVGLIAYGLFELIKARYRRIHTV